MNQSTLFLMIVSAGLSMVTLGCGDPLADAEYRGDPLFEVTGSTEPLPDFTGAEFLCSNAEFDCTESCEELAENLSSAAEAPLEDPLEGDGDRDPAGSPVDNEDDPNLLVDECFNACFEAFNTCLAENNNTGFNEAYYDSQASQRIAILWANPGAAPMSVQPQRTLTSTEFPARYTFSVFHPPAASLLFDHPDGPYAFGLVVSFIDQNRNERLDIREEPIIGFNNTRGILFHSTGAMADSGALLERGYQTFRAEGDCLADTLYFDESTESTGEGNVIAITGSTPQIFDVLPDVDCDGDMTEWRTLCETPQNRSRCAQLAGRTSDDGSLIDLYGRVCDFCAGRTAAIEDDSGDPDESNQDEPGDSD